MDTKVYRTSEELGAAAARYAAQILNEAIAEQGYARLTLSTGASQLDTLKALVQMDVDWRKVEMFHLDEYMNLASDHPASFRKYLKEKFTDLLPLAKAHFVNPEGDVAQNILDLTNEIRKAPIDLGLIGVGENAHIAFNDPPADFDTKEAYIVVNLDEACKQQQVSEGWFKTMEEVPRQAISMTAHQIMQCKVIVSCVPYAVKAKAIRSLFEHEVTNQVPATILKTHPHVTLFLDEASASLIDVNSLATSE
ncbi:6-phosphogluconolactonase [Alicyclobacillus fodiniaquatilis]|jgi:glucosamine-6-phosphate deaminase|uniref:6-phosphogluconolactonase n=1 Tax=Alicyclobacillus fodiniaquatilis TaxID=1661150 RepID=A0ABW4JKB1_9BACL